MTAKGHTGRLDATIAVLAVVAFVSAAPVAAQSGEEPELSPAARLGAALFSERNVTNPGLDYGSSCGECHVDGSRSADRADRAFADSVPLSLLPGKQTTLRNTPTLVEAASWRWQGSGGDGGWRGNWDGSAESLEELLVAKLSGAMAGWGEGDAERARALSAIQVTLASEAPAEGAPYAERFQQAFGIDVAEATPEQAGQAAAKALAAYLETLTSSHTSRWDAFAEQNRLRTGPNEGQSAQDYSFFLESRIGNQEGRRLVKRPEGFDEQAYEGFKIFFRTLPDQLDPEAGVGQCVRCHTPPDFRDGRFRNVGIAELEYDALWGAGAADRLDPATVRRGRPTRDDAAAIDLGRLHVAQGEPGAHGAFKTPALRGLAGTGPYMHNGAYATLEDAVRAKILAAQRARAGQLAHADPIVAEIQLDDADVAPLAAFLRQLDDVGAERFRYDLIHFDE